MTGSESPPPPGLELLTRVEATVDAPLDLGLTPHGHRRVVPITGGRLVGDRLTAEILPGGADWQVIHAGNWLTVEARYTVRAADGGLISILSQGVRHGPPKVMARLLAGQSPDPTTYRFRTAIRFTAGDGPHAWLNQIVAVGSALRLPSAVIIDVYEVT